MPDQREQDLVPELQLLQTRLNMSVNLFRQISQGHVSTEDVIEQLENVLGIYNKIPPDHRLEIEVDEEGYREVGGQGYDFARVAPDPNNLQKNRYFIIVKAPVEDLQDMPKSTFAAQLARKDLSPTGPTAFELMLVGKGMHGHGPSLWPQRVLSMKIARNTTTPIPGH